jgi:hypothetical protein
LDGIVGDRQRSNESSVQVTIQRNIFQNVIIIMLPVDDFLTEVAPIFAVKKRTGRTCIDFKIAELREEKGETFIRL